MTWVLGVLTPTFIGSGDRAMGLDFVVDNGTVRFIDPETFFPEDPALLQRVIDWLDQHPQNPSLPALLTEPWTAPLRKRLEKCAQVSLHTSESEPRIQDIQRFMRDGMHRCYIPGSTIKGMLRTAILLNLLDELSQNDARQVIRKSLNDRSKHPAPALEQQLFRGGNRNAWYDLLRFLHVADSASIRPERMFVGEIRLIGSRRNLQIYAECLQPNVTIALLPFSYTVEPLRRMHARGIWQHTPAADWLEDTQVQERLFKICQYWAQLHLQNEENYWTALKNRASNAPDVAQIADDVLNHIRAVQNWNDPQRPVLRLGMHRGALSFTVGLWIREVLQDRDLYTRWARRVVHQGRAGWHSPKTRKVVYYNGRWYPPGWCVLATDPEMLRHGPAGRSAPSVS